MAAVYCIDGRDYSKQAVDAYLGCDSNNIDGIASVSRSLKNSTRPSKKTHSSPELLSLPPQIGEIIDAACGLVLMAHNKGQVSHNMETTPPLLDLAMSSVEVARTSRPPSTTRDTKKERASRQTKNKVSKSTAQRNHPQSISHARLSRLDTPPTLAAPANRKSKRSNSAKALYSYAESCCAAIISNPARPCMSLSMMCAWMSARFAHFPSAAEDPVRHNSWTSSVRHNLTMNSAFDRRDRSEEEKRGGLDATDRGSGDLWYMNKEKERARLMIAKMEVAVIPGVRPEYVP